MSDRLDKAFADIRAEIAAANVDRDRFGTIAAAIRVNALRLGASYAEIDAMVRGEASFVNFMAEKLDPKSSQARLRALLLRAHDAMSRRDPDGVSEADWDQLVADIAKEVGL